MKLMPFAGTPFVFPTPMPLGRRAGFNAAGDEDDGTSAGTG